MNTPDARDAMVVNVQAHFAAYPTFVSLPENDIDPFPIAQAIPVPAEQGNYIAGLYAFYERGSVIRGRRGNSLVGE